MPTHFICATEQAPVLSNYRYKVYKVIVSKSKGKIKNLALIVTFRIAQQFDEDDFMQTNLHELQGQFYASDASY